MPCGVGQNKTPPVADTVLQPMLAAPRQWSSFPPALWSAAVERGENCSGMRGMFCSKRDENCSDQLIIYFRCRAAQVCQWETA
jgi:hypothetical protein